VNQGRSKGKTHRKSRRRGERGTAPSTPKKPIEEGRGSRYSGGEKGWSDLPLLAQKKNLTERAHAEWGKQISSGRGNSRKKEDPLVGRRKKKRLHNSKKEAKRCGRGRTAEFLCGGERWRCL